MEETKDPFTTFGGHEVDTESDPFAKFGGMEVKKKLSTNALESGGQPLKIGGITDLNSLISTPQNNDPYTVITDHALKNDNLHGAPTHDQRVVNNARAMGTVNKPVSPPSDNNGGFLNSISNTLKLPAFNKSFNDLTLKPYAAMADFTNRTINKVYHGITGEDAPEWLAGNDKHDDVLHKVVKYYDDQYQNRKKPTNIVGDIAEGVVGTLPLMASLATGEGEASLATSSPQFFSKMTKILAGTGAANAYEKATEDHKGYIESLKEAGKGGVEGAKSSLSMEAQMLVGGALGKGVAGRLAEKGLLKGGKAAESVLHALGVGTVFGGSSAGNDLLNGRDIDTHEAMKQFGTGLVFELPKIVGGLKEAVGDAKEKGAINNDALKTAALSDAASNLHSESVLRTFINTPTDQILAINDNVKEGHEPLYAQSIEAGSKAYDEKDNNEKRNLYTNQLVLKTQGDIKYVADQLKNNPDKIEVAIKNADDLPPEEHQQLIEKINALKEQVDNHPVLSDEQQVLLPTPEEKKAQNDEMDKKISDFQAKFPDHHIDPLADLPEHVVRTFDRVDNDLPTDPVAINEASDWLYNKYKELGKLKESDTRTLTIPQIEAMQEQLGEDITTLENHKLKYHGEEQGQPTSQATSAAEAQPEAQVVEPADGGGTPANATEQPAEVTSPVVKENLPTETPSDNEPISPIRQKAIDAVTHGIVGHINAREGEQGARFDLGMSAKENRKAVSDVMNGKYETGPAKKLLSKIEEFETNGDYPIIEGTGGNSIRRRGATPEEIQQNIDEAKQYKAQKLSEEQSAQFNTHAQEHGLTEEDFDNYEKYRTDPTGEPASIARDAQNVTDKVQQPSNDGTASPSQDTSSEIAQDVPTKRAGVEQPKAGDPLRSFADKVRQGKINKLGGFRASTGFDGVWDGSLEVVAKSIEGGAKIADAIESGLNHIKQTDWYKSLSERESFDEQYRNHLNNEYTEHEKTSPIKNATSEERAAEQGLKIEDTRNGKRGADIVDADAAKTISEGYDTPDLVHRILNEKHQASDTEVAILSKYADAKEKEIKDYDKDLTDNGATMSKGDFNAILAKKEQALSDLQDVLQAARKTGTETARALAARRNAYSQEYSLANMVARKRESLGGEKLTKEQFDDINKRFDELEEARNDFEAKVKKLEEENAKLRANQNVKQTAAERLKRKSVKLEGIDTKKKQLVEDWRKELKKIRTSMSATVPYARELAATAPFVTKYLKYLAEEGVVELKDIVDRIHETFKEDLPDLTKRDVVDILAGNYDEQKPTRSKLTSDIQSLKTQAKLLAQIEDLEKGIKSDNPNSNSERGKNEAVQRLRTRLKELQSEDEPTPDEKDISAYKKRIQARIDDVQERLDNDDYEKPEKKVPLKLDQEALELRRKYDRLKSNFDIEVAKDQLRQRTKTQKFWDDFLNVAALPRALKASLDFSAVLRQGLFASVGHPTIALKAFKEMFGQTFSEKRYSDWLSDIKHSEFYDLMQDSDLYISDKNDPKLLAREEEFTSNLGEKIPVLGKAIAASERAYTGYLNVLRTGVFADGAQRLIERGYTFEKNPEQFKALAKVVNVLTGRGDIPEFLGGKQPKVLSNVLFSPRFMASRIQTLYLWADPRLTGAARVMAAKDIGSTLALGGVILGLAHLSGLKVVTDPRSSQFLKVQDKEEHGTTYYDILGGLPQYVRFLSQQISGKKVPNNGGVIDLTTGKFGKPTRLSEAANFARGKVSPFVGMGLNLMEGKDVVGQPYHLWPNVPQEFTPLPFSDVQEAYKVGGIDNALKTFLPSQFGVGVSSYDPKSKKKK